MKTLIVVIGAPGAGKSTAVRDATAQYDRLPMPKDEYPARDVLLHRGQIAAIELGNSRPDFPGTDTLPMDINPVACRYLEEAPEQPPVVVAEGARLSNGRFLTAAIESGYRTVLIHLDNPLAEQWRAERSKQLGTEQNRSWAQGRRTAAVNLADNPPEGTEVFTVTSTEQATNTIIRLIKGA